MRNLLSLAIVGLTVVSFPVNADHKFSGSIRLDAQIPFEPSDDPFNLFLSRARIDIKGDIAQDWTYKIRFDDTINFGVGVLNMKLPVAKATWKISEQLSLNLGIDAPNYSQADTDAQTYIVRSVGVLEDSIGSKIGANISGILNKRIGYSVGLWRSAARASVADNSFSSVALDDQDDSMIQVDTIASVINSGGSVITTLGQQYNRIAYGGRLSYVVSNSPDYLWGVGLGVQSLDVIIPTVINTSDPYWSSFEKRLALTADNSIARDRFCLNTAIHYFNYYRDLTTSTPTASIASTLNAFQHKNHAFSSYAELIGLVIGNGYAIDPSVGVVNKIIFNNESDCALEIALRVGNERYYNFAAANFLKGAFSSPTVPSFPYTYTKNDGYNAIALTSLNDVFVASYQGYTLHATYYMTKNILLKAEFYDAKTAMKVASVWTTLEKEQGLRLRSEVSF
jgi:hypothetical protein